MQLVNVARGFILLVDLTTVSYSKGASIRPASYQRATAGADIWSRPASTRNPPVPKPVPNHLVRVVQAPHKIRACTLPDVERVSCVNAGFCCVRTSCVRDCKTGAAKAVPKMVAYVQGIGCGTAQTMLSIFLVGIGPGKPRPINQDCMGRYSYTVKDSYGYPVYHNERLGKCNFCTW